MSEWRNVTINAEKLIRDKTEKAVYNVLCTDEIAAQIVFSLGLIRAMAFKCVETVEEADVVFGTSKPDRDTTPMDVWIHWPKDRLPPIRVGQFQEATQENDTENDLRSNISEAEQDDQEEPFDE